MGGYFIGGQACWWSSGGGGGGVACGVGVGSPGGVVDVGWLVEVVDCAVTDAYEGKAWSIPWALTTCPTETDIELMRPLKEADSWGLGSACRIKRGVMGDPCRIACA